MKLSICQQFTRHASLWLTDGKVYLVSDVNAGVQVVLGTKKEAYRNTWLACTAAVIIYFWRN